MRPPVICGVDEAGRGPLAGPVYAGAVILYPHRPVDGLKDSKQLSATRRDWLEGRIKECALAWAVGRATVEEIDALNILQATFLAMTRALQALKLSFDEVWVDGNQRPPWTHATRTVVGGDASVAQISAASILAKTARDREMRRLHACFPQYDFAAHKGYGTAAHLAALRRHGPCTAHRRSFNPLKSWLAQGELPLSS